ncbi:MAG: flippase-like domain-containing protein [Desulfarculus sp.]|nr:flippase-like domain-containing protein [Desulfarculus sp.]
MAGPEPISALRLWWRLGLGLALLLILFLFLVDPRDVWAHLRGADPLLLVLLMLWLSADRLLMSYKWTLLLHCRGLAINQSEALRAYYLGTFAGCFLPTTLGADALRIGAVSHAGRTSQDVAASVIMERMLGMMATALAGLVGLVLLKQVATGAPPGRLATTMTITLGLAGGTLLLLVSSLSGLAGRLLERGEQMLAGRGKLGGWLGKLLLAYHQYRRHPRTLALFLTLSFLEQGSPVVANWLAAQALHLDISPLVLAAATPVAMALARVPIWFSSFGVVEGLFVFFFGLVGVGATEAFLLGLTTNVTAMLTALPGLFFYLAGGLRGKGGREDRP